jgi:hypothetical protein
VAARRRPLPARAEPITPVLWDFLITEAAQPD